MLGHESNLQQQKKAEDIQVTRELFDQQQEQAWSIVNDFKETNASLGMVSSTKPKYDSMQITQLRDELKNDKKSKTKEYEEMTGSVNKLLNLAQDKGMVKDEHGIESKVSFFDTFYAAKEAVDTYLFDHRGKRFSEKGERRFQVALRIKNLLNEMEGRLDQMQRALSSEESRKLQYVKLNFKEDEVNEAEELRKVNAIASDVTTFLKTSDQKTNIPEEEVNSSIQTWVANDYSSYLTEILDGKEITTEEDKNGFLAFMDKQNNRFVANKIAAQMILDRKKDVYLGMPWLREKLESMLKSELKAEDLFSKPAEFAVRVNEICNQFSEKNSAEIEKYKNRNEQIIRELQLPRDVTDIYDFSDIRDLIKTKNPVNFRVKLQKLKANTEPVNNCIDQELEKRFSAATRTKIKDKLYKHLGSLRVIGDAEQILTQTDMFFEMLAFSSPEEYRVERQIRNMLDKYKVDYIHRDIFLSKVTNGHPEQFNPDNMKQYEKNATAYSERIKNNTALAKKYRENKGANYASNQWDQFEEEVKSQICINSKDYEKKLKLALATQPSGKAMNLKDYQKKREQIERESGRQAKKRIFIAEERNKALEKDLGAKFYVHLAGDGNNIYLPYRNLAAAYADNRKEVALKAKQEETRYWQRKAALWEVLRSLGVEQKDYKIYENKFKWIMSGLDDTNADMSTEERLAVQRRNLEKFGVKDYKEALDKISRINDIKTIDKNKDVEAAKKRYDEGLQELENYDGGKYKELALFILSIPDVYKELLKGKDDFGKFLTDTLDAKLESFMKGCGLARKAGEHVKDKDQSYIASPIRQQYAYQFIRSIYEGRLSGDAAFFKDQLTSFQNKIMNVAPEGGVSINDAFDNAAEQLRKLCKKNVRIKSSANVIFLTAMPRVNKLLETTEGLKILMDKEALKKFVKEQFDDCWLSKKQDYDKREATENNEEWEDLDKTKKIFDARDEIQQNKQVGLKAKKDFFGMNEEKLQEVRQNKSLVRTLQKGNKAISLDPSRVAAMRDRVEKICGDLDLPQVLKDALTEKASHGGIIKGTGGTNWKDTLLFSHGIAMKRMYELLRVDRYEKKVGENGMSDEEALMFIVKSYGNPTFVAQFFDKPKELKIDDIIKTPEYKAFRSVYKKLVTLERLQADDPSLQEEICGISRNIRTMLISGMGVRDENGKDMDFNKSKEVDVTKRIDEIADNSIKYVAYWNQVMALVRPEFLRYHREAGDAEKSKNGDSLPQHYIDRQMNALRQYLMRYVIDQIRAKQDFNPELYKELMKNFQKKEYREFLETDKSSVSHKEEAVKQRTALTGSTMSEKDIEKIINDSAYVFKGKVNKYKALSDDEKQLFAVALMHLHKSTLGIDTGGTMSLLVSDAHKLKGIGKLQKQVDNYIAGKEFHFDINYTDAVNNLVNYGINKWGYTKHAMSDEAYEKAMKFVKTVATEKAMNGEKDMERMEDPKYSVFAAYNIADKKQQTRVDFLRKKDLNFESVKKILVGYAKKDSIETKEVVKDIGKNVLDTYKTWIVMPFKQAATVEKAVRINRRMDYIVKRFSKMSEGDMKMMIRILQERTVLDKSMIKQVDGSVRHVDQQKRDALLEALAGDASISSEVMKGFDSNEACLRAITTAMSFKLRDDMNFKGKELTEDCFEKKSLKRKTMIDWDLIENALKFFDEVMEKRTAIQAVKNSADLIKYCGNEKAIKAHEKLKADFAQKEDFKQENFEEIVGKQAESSESDSIKSALAGFHALTPQQKILFFKALGQRDILDITKKDYWKIVGRNFVNQAGRNKLIDEYIDSQKGDNIGMQLEPDECYKAMEALYTTQISDRVKLSKVSDLKDIFSYERNFIMQRDTAIDWKLFKRALNFVNRATQELEMTEGNELLYRGAGNLVKNGQMKMNYSFLRQNFHKTGNQMMRKIIVGGASAVKNQVDPDNKTGKILKTASKIKNIAPKVGKILGFSDESYLIQGINKVSDAASEAKTFNDEQLADDKVLDTRSFKKIQDKIDDILKQDRSARQIMDDIKKCIDVTLQEKLDDNSGDEYVKEETQEANKTDYVIEQGKNANLGKKKGDIRDTYKKAQDIKKIVKVAAPIGAKVVKALTPEDLKDITRAVDYAIEKATLKFMNDKVFGQNNDPKAADQLKELKNAAGQYLDEMKHKVKNYLLGIENKKQSEAIRKQIEIQYASTKARYLKQVTSAINNAYFIKSTVSNVMDIADSAMNIRTLNNVKAEKEELKQGDKKKLDDAQANGRLDQDEKVKAEKAAGFNSAMGETAASISKAMQALGIAEGTIKVATDLAKKFGGKYNLGSQAILKAIDSGLEFAHFAIRICTDKAALRDYYVHTKAGQAEVEKLKAGYKAAGNIRLHDEFATYSKPQSAKTRIVDMIASAKGYEGTSELVENTGMQMAQSIIFSASDYNPMAESKVMAITVLGVLKLDYLINDTSAAAVWQLFNAFAMSR